METILTVTWYPVNTWQSEYVLERPVAAGTVFTYINTVFTNRVVDLTYLTYALSLPVEHRPQTTRLHPALSCAAVSIFLQLNLKPAVHISLSRSLFHVFLGRPLSLWPCGVHCSTCLAMLSSLLLSVWPIQFHFFLLSWSRTGSSFVFFTVPSWLFCLASVYLESFSGIY